MTTKVLKWALVSLRNSARSQVACKIAQKYQRPQVSTIAQRLSYLHVASPYQEAFRVDAATTQAIERSASNAPRLSTPRRSDAAPSTALSIPHAQSATSRPAGYFFNKKACPNDFLLDFRRKHMFVLDHRLAALDKLVNGRLVRFHLRLVLHVAEKGVQMAFS